MNCGTCRFFCSGGTDGIISIRDAGSLGPECHRRAPVLTLDRALDECWPRTSAESWCGEYEPEILPQKHLAKYCHEIWCSWMQVVFGRIEDQNEVEGTTRFALSSYLVDSWIRRMSTAFDDLPEGDKEAAKDEARKIMNIIKKSGR